ncbi:hypothetical protein LOZ07_006775 [Ophidiomyces ophidiicola]|nr:hypothetical protein LOZ27_001411 [Ophidiomyces ophidiicola]KAI2266106.1 hypothetical protein LOZ05_004347 [Ophidiomyces ophidiicola]KAI2284826.1 hypothetical protein LOZ07_006775 [Ophidiomyces ophidiicola]KAI2291886.1 hypothetical protein LOZ06_006704 [Ophidiomyces ophidiicola]KAI2402206.1 hypothetical protein LOZ67_000964 [Ophidiomyces ophidiicola]
MAAATASSWQTTAQIKRESLLALIPEKWRVRDIPPAEQQRNITGTFMHRYLTAREIEITECDAVGVLERTTTGQWSAVEVHCLHEIFFEAALDDARRLDAFFAEHQRPMGALHGVPISLKDQFHVRGVETTMGYVGWIGSFQGVKDDARAGVFESELVGELRALGAVLHCKTAVPATLMRAETVNNIVGYTWNPANRQLSAGGSSGGEAALIALRGSAAGFGSDIGGSVRIPCGHNGLYGLRPSAGRIPYEGAANSMDGQNAILSVIGPMATSARDVKLLFQAVLSQRPWLHDPLALELPWRDEVETETLGLISQARRGGGALCFGIIHNDGACQPEPPVARALRVLERTLTGLGHKASCPISATGGGGGVIEWSPPSHARGIQLATSAYRLDNGADAREQFGLSGERLEPFEYVFANTDPPADAQAVAALNVAKRAYQKEYLEYWNASEALTGTGRAVDGVIWPVAPYAAARRDGCYYVGYTSIVNVLDYSAMAIPVTTADAALDARGDGFAPYTDAHGVVHDLYDPQLYDGTPVGLQLVGRRFHEEKLIVLAEYISEVLRGV